jgi:hypothetical protein
MFILVVVIIIIIITTSKLLFLYFVLFLLFLLFFLFVFLLLFWFVFLFLVFFVVVTVWVSNRIFHYEVQIFFLPNYQIFHIPYSCSRRIREGGCRCCSCCWFGLVVVVLSGCVMFTDG